MKDEEKTREQLIDELAKLRRKLAEADLRRSDLFGSIPAMIPKLRNENGILRVRECNWLFLETLGYSFEEVRNRPLTDFYTPESRALFN